MRSLKKTLSLLLTLIMVSAFVQIPGQAAMANSAPKAQFKLVALSPDADSAGVVGKYGFAAVEPDSLGLPNKKVGDMFYVGIQVTGIDDIEEYATKGLGVTGLSAAFTYDKDYIQLVEDFTADENFQTSTWYGYMDVLMSQMYLVANRPRYYFYYKDSSNYTYDISACEAKADADGGDPTVYYLASWTGTEFSTSSSYVFADGDIIAVLPFKIVSMPGPGTELFSFSTKNTAYSLDFGIGTDAKAYQLANGDTVESEADPNDSTDILHVMEFNADGVNFFPESETADAITAKGTVTKTTQYADTLIDLTSPSDNALSAEFTENNVSTPADPSTYDWYFGALQTGETIDESKLTKIVEGTTKWPKHEAGTTTSKYYLYAVGKGCVDVLDAVEITVETDTVQSIANVSGSTPPTPGYANSFIGFANLKANVTMASGTEHTDVPTNEFADRGIALYKITGTEEPYTYTAIAFADIGKERYPEETADAVKYIIGTTATDSDGKPSVLAQYTPEGDGATPVDDVISLAGKKDPLTLATRTDNAIKTKYAVDAVIDPTALTFDGTLASTDIAGKMGWNDIKPDESNYNPDELGLFIADDNWDGKTGTAGTDYIEVNGTSTKMLQEYIGKKLYVRSYLGEDDGGNKLYSVIEVGTLAQRKPASITVTDIGTKTYGDTLGTVTITVTWDNGDGQSDLTEEPGEKADNPALKKEITEAGIVMRIGERNANNLDENVVRPETSMIPKTHNNKKLDFYASSDAATAMASTAPLVVNRAKIPVSVVPNTDVTRIYDGTTNLPTGAVTLTLAPTPSSAPWVTDDVEKSKYMEGIVPVADEGLTFEYDTRHASATDETKDKTVKYKLDDTKAALKAKKANTNVEDSVVTSFDEKYELVLDSVYDSTDEDATFADGTVAGLSGTIKKATLTVADFKFTSIDDVVQDNEDDKAKTGRTQSLVYDYDTTDDGVDGDGLLHADDVVQISYNYTYGNITQPTTNGATAPVDVSNIALVAGGQSGNYTLGGVTTATAYGTILPKEVEDISVNTAPTTIAYTYPNKTLDLTGLKIDVEYANSANPTPYDVADFLQNVDGALITLVDAKGNTVATLTKTNYDAFDEVCDLPYGEFQLVITVGSGDEAKTATLEQSIVAKKKPISLADLTLSYEGTYGDLDKATKTATIPDSALESGDEVTLDATFEPKNTNAGKTDVKVELSLTGGKAGNYVLVDVDGKEITETTIEGTINKADYTAPDAPKAKADLYNNTVLIDLAGVDTTGLEYVVVPSDATIADMDALDWFTASEMTAPSAKYLSADENKAFYGDTEKTVPYVLDATGVKVDLVPGASYKVYVRRAADANHNASAPASAEATLYPYEVAVSMAGSEDELFVIYTDAATLAEATDDITFSENVLNGWLPNRFKAFFSDLDATTPVAYGSDLKADADDDGKSKVYYTRKRTSSSSSGSTSLAGSVTITYDVLGNGIIVENDKNEKVPVGQSAAAVPTVTAKDGYVFLGWTLDGETVIDPTTVKITEDTVFVALFEKVEETDPVIDPNYIDPYANGYPDGSFQADRVLTRGELAAMIARIHYEDELPNNTYYASFEDVQEGDWYNKYIGYVEGLGVMNGYPDGTFRPTNPITRAEFASVLVRAQKYDIVASDELFNDIAGHWAKDNITTLGSLKVVNGYEDGTFLPENPLTRGEAVTMINRILKPSKIVSDNRPNDIDGHWAEDAIYLAVNERMLIEEGAEEAAEEAAE